MRPKKNSHVPKSDSVLSQKTCSSQSPFLISVHIMPQLVHYKSTADEFDHASDPDGGWTFETFPLSTNSSCLRSVIRALK